MDWREFRHRGFLFNVQDADDGQHSIVTIELADGSTTDIEVPISCESFHGEEYLDAVWERLKVPGGYWINQTYEHVRDLDELARQNSELLQHLRKLIDQLPCSCTDEETCDRCSAEDIVAKRS